MIKGSKKLINAWAFYDWANSVYPLVISTAVFPLYFDAITKGKKVLFLGLEWNQPNALYGYALSLSFLVVAFLSPILSGIADFLDNKKQFLQFFCLLGGFSVMGLSLFKDVDTVWLGIIFGVLGSIGFWGSIVFYNAYLPEVAYPEQQDRASAKGFALGYIGSVILLIISLILIEKHSVFNIEKGVASRISFVLVGLWWISFAQITFAKLPESKKHKKPQKNIVFKGFKELQKVFKELEHKPNLKLFLIAFFLLSISVQTVILMATLFGSSELELPTTNLIVTVILIQLVAIVGAWFFSKLSEKKGNLFALKTSIFIWMFVCLCAFMLHKEQTYIQYYFYALGGLLGLVLGAIQSLSRSTYSKLLPKTQDNATYFSFFDVTEKIAIVVGTFVYSFLLAKTGSMQWSVLSLALFFLASFLVIKKLKPTKYVK